VGRLAAERPGLAFRAAALLPPCLKSEDVWIRGHAAWVAASLDAPDLADLREKAAEDPTPLRFYLDGDFYSLTVGELARGLPRDDLRRRLTAGSRPKAER
jgi:hypothetical protein